MAFFHKRNYTVVWQGETGQWEVCSRSGHVLCSAASRTMAAQVCFRLNNRFAGRATGNLPAPPLRIAPRSDLAGMFATAWTAAAAPALG